MTWKFSILTEENLYVSESFPTKDKAKNYVKGQIKEEGDHFIMDLDNGDMVFIPYITAVDGLITIFQSPDQP